MKRIVTTALLLAGCMGLAQAQSSIVAEFQGPGGHSSSNYGRTSALHAAARAMIELQKSGLPTGSYAVSELTGGNSVNSIASDGKFVVTLAAGSTVSENELLQKVTAAAKAGAEAENAFRKVKPGDLTGGAPADIRYTVTQQ